MNFDDWLLTPERVAVHRPTATAVVADLHLGYQEARRLAGDAIPLVPMDILLAPLLSLLQAGRVSGLIVAGDLFERAFDATVWHDFQTLVAKTAVRFLGLVPGNHDRRLEAAPPSLPVLAPGHSVGAWRVFHGETTLPETPVVLGHFHPYISHRGRRVPCYLAKDNRLVLPAYSRDAAGVSVHSSRRWRGHRCLGIAAGRIIDLGVLPTTRKVSRARKASGEA